MPRVTAAGQVRDYTASAAKKKAKPKSTSGPAGPAGKNGTTGANGAPGAQGPAGAAGAKGETGPAGAGTEGKEGKEGKGTPGANGKSVNSTEFKGNAEPAGKPCKSEGGTSFEVEGTGTIHYACNGEEGEKGEAGKEGSPWTDKGVLPKGATETGVWAATYNAAEAQAPDAIPLSFNIPLEATSSFTTLIKKGTGLGEGSCTAVGSGGCDGSIEKGQCTGNYKEPGAGEGSLCVFEAVNINATGFQALVGSEIEASQVGNGTTGAQVILASTAAGLVFANGTWAVTAN